ncbi:MAG: fimbria/pilus periplasmic chaperone [Alcanivorax sp.]|nr:fimbria/pilus periplasmic chaperone [Alcanivorax sp.]
MNTIKQSLLLLLMALCATANAGQLTVAPLGLTLQPNQDNATLTLTNGAGNSSYYQIQLFAWSQRDGKRQLRQQQQLVVSPPVTLIPANATQTIRIVRQAAIPTQAEQSYRLIISEIPERNREKVPNRVQMLLRLSVPIFVGSDQQQPQLSARIHDHQLMIKNLGNKHARLVRLAVVDSRNKEHVLKRGLAGYVLPASAMFWDLPAYLNASKIHFVSFTLEGENTSLTLETDSQ